MESVLVDPIPWNVFPVDVTSLMPPLEVSLSSSVSEPHQPPTPAGRQDQQSGAAAAASLQPPPLFRSSGASLMITGASIHDDDYHVVNWVRPAAMARTGSSGNIDTLDCQQQLPNHSGIVAAAGAQQQQDNNNWSAAAAPLATINNLDELLLSKRVEGLLCGVSAFVIAVGNSGSGPRCVLVGSPEVPGLIPRACDILLSRLQVQSVSRVHTPYAVATSFVALLPTRIIDLCEPANLTVRVCLSREGYVLNAKRRLAESPDDALDTLDEGLEMERALIEAGDLPPSGACATVFSIMFTSNTGAAASLVFVLVGGVRAPQNRSAVDTLIAALQVTREAVALPDSAASNQSGGWSSGGSGSRAGGGGGGAGGASGAAAAAALHLGVAPPDLLQTSPLTRLLAPILRPVGTWVVDFLAAFESTDGVSAELKRRLLAAASSAAASNAGATGSGAAEQHQSVGAPSAASAAGGASTVVVAQASSLLPSVTSASDASTCAPTNSRDRAADGSSSSSPPLTPSRPPATSPPVAPANVEDYDAVSELRDHSTIGGTDDDEDDDHNHHDDDDDDDDDQDADGGDGRGTAEGDSEQSRQPQTGGGGAAGSDARLDQPADCMSHIVQPNEIEEAPTGCYASPSVAAAVDALHTLLQLVELARFPVSRPLHDTVETAAFAPKRRRHPHRRRPASAESAASSPPDLARASGPRSASHERAVPVPPSLPSTRASSTTASATSNNSDAEAGSCAPVTRRTAHTRPCQCRRIDQGKLDRASRDS